MNYEQILNNLSPNEREVALKVLKEYGENGKSQTLDKLQWSDFDEIPVDIYTFITDDRYLGRGVIDKDGKQTIFPYWIEMLKKLFPNNMETRYNTLILTGAIGLGKSMCAVLCMLYLLYRMLCLKDPYLHYGLQPIDKITFSLINVTIEAAKGVAWDKLQQLVQSSPWFMSHGKMSGRTDIIWTPDKRIELVVGSSNNAVIGRAVFCLDGNTEILTDKGYKKMKSLVDKKIKVVSYDNGKLYLSSQCTVKPTGISDIEYHIELEDGTVLKCTENHKFLFKELGYIKAKDIVVGDIMVGAQPDLDLEVTEVSVVTLKEPKQFYDVVEASPLHNFIVKTICGNIVSHNCNFTDKEI